MTTPHFILLVDDSDDDAFFFDRAVARVGVAVQTSRVRDGQEAIDYLLGVGKFSDRQQFPIPHLVMLDLKMPVCDGFDFLEWKKQQTALACVRVVVMTSSRLERDIRRSYELGADSYTTKVSTTERLADRITALRDWWFQNVVLLTPARSA